MKKIHNHITNELHTTWWENSLLDTKCRDEFDILVLPLYGNGSNIISCLYWEIIGNRVI